MKKIIYAIRTKPFFKYAALVLIAMLSAINYEVFIRPNSFAPAGINGIATMVQQVAGFFAGIIYSLSIRLGGSTAAAPSAISRR